NFLFAIINCGLLYYGKHDYQTAIRYYDRYLHLDSRDALCYKSRGLAYLWLSQWEEAEADFEKALQYGKNDSTLYANLGCCCWAGKRDMENSLFYFEKAIQIGYPTQEFYEDDNIGHFIKDLVKT